MARPHDPPVDDRLDQHDFDGDPAPRWMSMPLVSPRASSSSDLFCDLSSFDGTDTENYYHWGLGVTVLDSVLGVQDRDFCTMSWSDTSTLDDFPEPETIMSSEQDLDQQPRELSATTLPFGSVFKCCFQHMTCAQGPGPQDMARKPLATTGMQPPTATWPRPPLLLVQEPDGTVEQIGKCYCSPTSRHLGAMTQTLSVAVGQRPEYVVKLLERTSKPDDPSFLALQQPTPFVNHYAQRIAEFATIYDHQFHHDLSQYPSIFETELSEMSVATPTNVDRIASENTTQVPEIDAILSTMAATTTGWPSEGQPVCAAPHDLMDNTYQGSPLTEPHAASDERGDWDMFMPQDMFPTGNFDINFDTDFFSTETYPQTINFPEDIVGDPAVVFDVAQSLQADFFSTPLSYSPTSWSLSGTDQLSISSHVGSANTSPFESSLEYLESSVDSLPALFGTITTPASGSDADPYPYRCFTDNCTKTFRKEAQLKQHQRVHRKALVCNICRAEQHTEHKFAQVRDLERHLQARHPEVARKDNVRSEIRECPHRGCEHRGRRDNVSRHHESKHGKKLKWKRGVPHIVD